VHLRSVVGVHDTSSKRRPERRQRRREAVAAAGICERHIWGRWILWSPFDQLQLSIQNKDMVWYDDVFWQVPISDDYAKFW
jgi:hypothetical protein